MSDRPPFYVTTPIYYVNDRPHIGHAYTTIACDVLARFARLDGRQVLFLTGTDEHGQKVEKSAAAAGVDPQAFCDQVSAHFREMTTLLDCSNDQFIRTTEARHTESAQALWQRIADAGWITEGSYAGWYAVRDEAFYTEDELTEGPDGGKLAPTGAPVEWTEEPSYFFKLSAFAEPLLELYEQHPDMILPETRRNEVVSFVKGGLRDLSISRTSFKWGIGVPGDDDHIMYVWLDALTNYITALGFPDTDDDRFSTFWPADVHMVGKDILRFHAVYWPAFLLAAGLEPPKRIFAHGWWTNDGQKISKSLGNVIDPVSLVETYGVDPLRYFLFREVPFGKDGDFSHRAMIGRLNGELANDIGNLCQRVLSMVHKNCDGAFPEPGELTDDDRALLSSVHGLVDVMRPLMDRQDITGALARLLGLVGDANRYVDAQAPWTLKKTDTARMATVLWVLAETVRHVAVLLQPWCPSSAAKMLDQMGRADDARDFTALGEVGAIAGGTPLDKPEGVFPRFVEE